MSGALARGTLSASVRERIAITVAEANGCEYCLSAHTYIGGNIAKVDEARQLIQEIDAALGCMDRGTYGLCERCQVPIPVERLEAMPHARFCVQCAETGGSPLG